MSFICKICDYETTKKGNINRHNKSKKHLSNVLPNIPKNLLDDMAHKKVMLDPMTASQSIPMHPKTEKIGILCAFCDIQFTRSSSLMKHLLKCPQKLESDKTTELEYKLKEKERMLEEKEKQLKEHKIEKEYYKELINNYSKFGPKTFNSITYVMNRYADAPHIKKIEPEKIEYFQDINMTKVENMVSDYRNDRFVTFIINTIITLHKKENPEDQAIWSTDSSRYNYLIKELLENEDSYWVVDKKGSKSQNYLIEPILKFIRKEIIKYNELVSEALLDENLPKSRFSIITNTQRYGIDIIKDIDDGILGDDIIKKMAKYFYHKSHEVPLIEEIE